MRTIVTPPIIAPTGPADATVRAELRAAVMGAHRLDLAIVRAAPREALGQALCELSPIDLGRLIARLGDETLADILDKLDAVDAARLVRKLGLAQATDVLLEEAGEDMERLGGSLPLEEPYLRASLAHLFRKRIGWLLVLFVAEAYTGTVLRHFETTLSEMVALAFFIPLLIGTGGNTGSQTVTMLVRALAVGEVQFRDLWRVLRRELGVGALLGLVMGLVTYARAWMLGVGGEVGPVVAVTATFIVVWAAAVGAMLPLILHRLEDRPGGGLGAAHQHSRGRDRAADLLRGCAADAGPGLKEVGPTPSPLPIAMERGRTVCAPPLHRNGEGAGGWGYFPAR